MNAVSLLCEIIGQAGKVAARTYRDNAGYGALLEAGLIQCDGLVGSVLCENCDVPHDAEIVFEGGSYGHFCPDLGFVPVERDELVAVRPDLVALVEHLRAAFECSQGSMAQLGQHTWRVGLVDTPGGRAVVYFHPYLQHSDELGDLETALRTEIRRDYSLVVTAAGKLQYGSATTRKLGELVDLDPRAARLRRLVSVADAVGAPPKATGGRPSVHRERLHDLLAERATHALAKEGRNAEAQAVLGAYIARYPNDPAPALSTVKAYVSEFRSG